jgi:hypothetical protein
MHDSIEQLRRFARDLRAEVDVSRAEMLASGAIAADARRRPRRLVVALATTALMLLSNVALAAAADPAIPGDTLYGMDRAYEAFADGIGLGGPHAGERVSEAAALLAVGDTPAALVALDEALAEIEQADDPAAAFGEMYGAHTEEFEDLKEELLGMTRDAAAGEVDGQTVAEIARQLVCTVQRPPQSQGKGPDRCNE